MAQHPVCPQRNGKEALSVLLQQHYKIIHGQGGRSLSLAAEISAVLDKTSTFSCLPCCCRLVVDAYALPFLFQFAATCVI